MRLVVPCTPLRGQPRHAIPTHIHALHHAAPPPCLPEPFNLQIHGLGDTSLGWMDIGEMLGPNLPNTKWVFPTAPVRPITLNGAPRWCQGTGRSGARAVVLCHRRPVA